LIHAYKYNYPLRQGHTNDDNMTLMMMFSEISLLLLATFLTSQLGGQAQPIGHPSGPISWKQSAGHLNNGQGFGVSKEGRRR